MAPFKVRHKLEKHIIRVFNRADSKRQRLKDLISHFKHGSFWRHDNPISVWTTNYREGDARTQADPIAYHDVARTIIQHEDGHIMCTTMEVDTGFGVIMGNATSNNIRVADLLHEYVADLDLPPALRRTPRLRRERSIQSFRTVYTSSDDLEHDVDIDRAYRWYASA